MKINIKTVLLSTVFICIFCAGSAYASPIIGLSFNPQPPFWPGEQIEVTASVTYPPQPNVQVSLMTQPPTPNRVFAEGYTDNNGKFTAFYTVPADFFTNELYRSYRNSTEGLIIFYAASRNVNISHSIDYYRQIIPPLTASFTYSLNDKSGNLKEVIFKDMSSGSPTSWSWNFGDGDASTEQNPVHKYKNWGSYTVTLTVSKGSNTATTTQTIVLSNKYYGPK